jgi:hypothetical protein
MIPVSPAIGVRATVQGNAMLLTWQDQPSGAATDHYRILRGSGPQGGLSCAATPGDSSDDCRLYMDSPGATRTTSFTDHPGRGTWTYRIGIAANWLDDPRLGDIYVVSPAVTVRIP